ncbi:MAG: hypothetical protein CMN28_05170 [Salinisphaeraceae bacterium]|nr:hypothetical protein [Salinisphaeraceae bacterium]
MRIHPRKSTILALACLFALSGCGGGGGGSSSGSIPGGSPDQPDTGGETGGETGGDTTAGRVFSIEPGENASRDALVAAVDARPGDVIEFACGFYDMQSTMLITATEDVTVRGGGRDCTVLSFRNNNAPEGILVDNVRGIFISDLTVADTDGNAFELRSVDHAELRNVRAFWSSDGGRDSPDPVTAGNYQDGRLDVACTQPATLDPSVPENQGRPGTISPDYIVSQRAGRYGIYPVKSRNVLVDNAESIGASDAGIYVGQTNTAIIRNSRAAHNVFGFEIENVKGGEYANNLAECNTGGFLIYDLDNLTQYGERSRMYGNTARMNNTYNFTEGGFVANVPPGSGMITLAYDRIDIFDNVFEDNNTGGIIHASYELFPEGAGRPSDRKIDFYTEGVKIFRNRFSNNGNALPAPTTTDLQNQDVARLLPTLVGLKTQAGCLLDPTRCPAGVNYRGAHIVWDGLLDPYDADCDYPTVDGTDSGDPVPATARGKPDYTGEHAQPACRYNAYKFDTDAPNNPRIAPRWFASCIEQNNDFSNDSVTYTNFNGTKGIEAALIALDNPVGLLDPAGLQSILGGLPQFAADLDWSAHDCQTAYGETLANLEPVVIPPFERSGDINPAPSEAEVAALCEVDHTPGVVNFPAAAVNCPRLDQYNLFAQADDPTSTPNANGSLDNAAQGLPFVLNTKLFSDYSVKYRVLFLPPNADGSATQPGTYSAPGASDPNATLIFPVGSIVAKTFSFPSSGVENHVETRLLIKRDLGNNRVRWVGLPYVWGTENGQRVARLQPEGAERAVSWDYVDVETGATLSGSTDSYSVPNANQCISCHANQDRESGAPPIGTKVRNLNRAYRSESMVQTAQSDHPVANQNQIAYLCDNGYLMGCPSDISVDANTGYATNLERSPMFKTPGDGGQTPGSDADIEARARAWLEVNCQHCHNPQGFAANTGYYLDVFRAVNTSYGICKGPTATGAEGSGGRTVDIYPSDAVRSILEFRLSEAADTPAARMPPIARSVVSQEGHALIEQWINDVIVVDENRYPGSPSCTTGGGLGGFPLR